MHVPWRINEWNATNKRGEILDTLNLKRVQMIMKKDFIQRLRMGKWTYRYLYLKYKNVLFANHIYIISRKAITFYMVICGWNILENIHTLILVLLPASSTRTDVCFFLLDVNFPLLCDPEFRAGDPIMVTFLPLLFRNEILRKGFIVNSIVYCNSTKNNSNMIMW